MPLNPVVIAGSLSKEELEKSINEIVKAVDSGMEKVSSAFDTKLAAIEENFKKAGTKIGTAFKDSFNAALGGSFDQLAAAMEKMSKVSTKGASAANAANASGAVSGARNKNITYPEDSIGELRQQIKELQTKLNYEKRSTDELQKQVDLLHQAKAELKTQTTTRSFSSILGMPENSATQIADKMKALRTVQVQNADEAKKLQNAYQRLSQRQKELLGNTNSLTSGNNALARSFGYIRNRLMYALTIGAVMNFVKQMYSVRAEYELLERSMGVLIDDFRRGSEIFNELNAMALKSPFTLVELGTAAKQLLAYNFAEDEVVDTTRRLADISAALGVPMERLVYNLGQIRAQTALTARDARDFANAGFAIVPMLAKMYTEQKKFGDEIVTTAQVYDMMSKKLVTYEDVMKVINQVTDEGGKFFDFQAKQAETLKVQLANLTLAWNNMLNDIASSNQTSLNAPIRLVKTMLQNWQTLWLVVQNVIAIYGAYKAQAILTALANSTLGKSIQTLSLSSISLSGVINALKAQWASWSAIIAANPIGAALTLMASAAVAWGIWGDKIQGATEWTERFGESGGKVVRDINNLYASLESVNQESSTYKKVLGELNQILGDYGLQQISEKDSLDQIAASREKNIQLIKEEIIERERLNNINAGQEKYENKLKDIRANLVESLSDAITTSFGIGTVNQEIAKNAPAIATIVESIIEENIDLIADKSGEEFEKGQQKIWDKIQQALKSNKALGLSEKTLNSVWQENDWIRWNSNIIKNTISAIREVKEEQNRWNRAIEEHAEIQKHDAQAGANFKDRVDQTSNSLMNAANDTEKFYQKINTLIKEYSGQNIIDFLVRVKSQVPAWMSKMGVSELTRLSAQFAAFAQNAEKSGLDKIDVNGKTFTKAELYERAAQYASALQTKTAEIESRQTSKLTSAASEALKDYKSSLEAVTIAKNKLKQGTADSTLVTEKEAEAQKKYNAALKAGVSEKELEEARLGKKGKGGSKKDELGDTLTKELQLITDIQKLYKEYTKAGVDSETAKNAAAKEYQKTLEQTNATLSKFGVQGLTGEQLATMDLRAMRDYYQSILDKVQSSPKAVEALEKAIRNLNVEITKEGQKTIIDSLNSELSKLKDEYELAVELDANPELGGVFADMMGLSKEELEKLPRDFEGVVRKLQSVVDKELGMGAFDVRSNLNKDVFDKWIKANKYSQDSDLVGKLKAITEYANKVRLDETKKQIEDWNKLLEKYAEYEYKRTQITQNAEKEREAARKKGAPSHVMTAIDMKEAKDLAKVNIEEFQQSSEWITATGDLVGLTDEALGLLIRRIEEFKKSQKYLDAKQIKQLNNALKQLYQQQRKGNPFLQLSNAIRENKMRREEWSKEIEEDSEILEEQNKKIDEGTHLTEEETKTRLKLIDRIKELKEGLATLKDVTPEQVIDYLNTINSVASQATGAVSDMMKAFGNTEDAETINKVMSTIEKGLQFAQMGAAIGGKAGGGWGAAIGGILGLLVGGLTSFAEEINGNAAITSQIQGSERAVKRLEIAYINLEKAVDEAYGTEEYHAIRIAQANKEAQLAELKRQKRLEESRSSKYRDENKILDLQQQIIELENEIESNLNNIINDFLGISNVGDAVEDMVGNLIEALRSGEDAMSTFSESIDDMIANMVKKVYAERILGTWFEEIWGDLEKDINKRTEDAKNELAETLVLQERLKNDQGGLVRTLIEATAQNREYPYADFYKYNKEGYKYFDAYGYLENIKKILQQQIEEGSKITIDDITKYAEMLRTGEPIVESQLEDLEQMLRNLGLIKDSASAKLSALQQGIQGITEDTASALEAMLNGISQQVYLHSDILIEIRDVLQSFDFDVRTGVQAQILLELQTGFQTVNAMRTMMENWQTAAGNGIKVEIL